MLYFIQKHITYLIETKEENSSNFPTSSFKGYTVPMPEGYIVLMLISETD